MSFYRQECACAAQLYATNKGGNAAAQLLCRAAGLVFLRTIRQPNNDEISPAAMTARGVRERVLGQWHAYR